jgi:CspA family cold shock protein
MTLGTIKRIVTDKGFGFIRPDFPDPDVFFHANDVEGTTFAALYEGQRVKFDVVASDRGPRAERVEVVEG